MKWNRLGENSAVPGIGIDPALSFTRQSWISSHLQIPVSCSAELGTITGSVLTSVATAIHVRVDPKTDSTRRTRNVFQTGMGPKALDQ